MRNAQNIQALTACKPDYIGFIFYPKSKRYIGDSLDLNTIHQIPDAIKKVGVFVNATEREVTHAVEYFHFDLIQLHGDEPVEYCEKLKKKGYHIIKAFGIDEDFDFQMLEKYKPTVDFFLFDTKSSKYGGTGEKYDWNILEKYDQSVPFFLSGGIGPDNLNRIEELQGYNIHAIDVNSKFELEPGLKDIDLLKNTLFKQQKL